MWVWLFIRTLNSVMIPLNSIIKRGPRYGKLKWWVFCWLWDLAGPPVLTEIYRLNSFIFQGRETSWYLLIFSQGQISSWYVLTFFNHLLDHQEDRKKSVHTRWSWAEPDSFVNSDSIAATYCEPGIMPLVKPSQANKSMVWYDVSGRDWEVSLGNKKRIVTNWLVFLFQ